ncbi:DUF4307 domain-containing protein [Paeniglutamicibacter cryotolerans]|uniref:DUF4307 domain-containing protein n=1 Tax=Paeniglutamicibacter cryotolerans TaxID=670079 RepID=A0A839QMU0_9MICC|nr:DUF4307 domain-containing protein [Paeniglutamicibacter cryotolerans]MBB2995925.1 hypothetical protein [Paeniglutamicibacter cryotolerans]
MFSPDPTPMTNGEAPVSSVANRYGTPKRKLSRQTKKVMVIAALALALVVVLWMSTANAKKVSFTDVSFEIPSSTSAVVVVEVTKDAEADVQCAVRVLNEAKAIVGFKTLTLGPSQGTGKVTIHSTVDLRTESLGTTGGIESCKVIH